MVTKLGGCVLRVKYHWTYRGPCVQIQGGNKGGGGVILGGWILVTHETPEAQSTLCSCTSGPKRPPRALNKQDKTATGMVDYVSCMYGQNSPPRRQRQEL